MLRRHEERWQPAAESARPVLADPDAAAAASAGVDVALAVHDAERNRIEGLEQAAAMAEEVQESDAPPGVELHAAGFRWLSCDGGATWHTRSAVPNGDVAGVGSGSGRNVDTGSNFGVRAGAGSNGQVAEPDGTGRRGHTTGIDAGVPAPPTPGAAVAALTLTEDDRATLGVQRLYAAAWANLQGVVIGTSTGDGSWRETLIAVPGGRGPCTLAATADGVLLACTDGTAVRCRRVPLDAFIGDGGHRPAAAANWHHDSADLIATLRERQPADTS